MDGYEILGVKRPEDANTGVNVQDPSQPAKEGVNAQDPSQPANAQHVAEEDAAAKAAAEEDAETDGAEGAEHEKDNAAPGTMSKEERAKQAKQRREAETQAKIDAALTAERQQTAQAIEKAKDDTIAALKIVNPFTKKLITSRAEYEAYQHSARESQINLGLKQAGIDREVIDALMDEHPAVAQARQLAAEAQLEKNRALDSSAETKFKTEMEEIQKYNPAIKGKAELLALPNYQDIKRYVGNGLSISDAYFQVNREEIMEKERKKAAQTAINSINGRTHLQQDGAARGTGGETLPTGVKDGYAKLYGNKLKGAETQKKYEETLKFKKG